MVGVLEKEEKEEKKGARGRQQPWPRLCRTGRDMHIHTSSSSRRGGLHLLLLEEGATTTAPEAAPTNENTDVRVPTTPTHPCTTLPTHTHTHTHSTHCMLSIHTFTISITCRNLRPNPPPLNPPFTTCVAGVYTHRHTHTHMDMSMHRTRVGMCMCIVTWGRVEGEL
jgi:hypothetical protein